MRLSLNYFGVMFVIASIRRFVFFSTIRLKWLVLTRMRCKPVSKRLSTVARWRHGQSSLEAPHCSAYSMRLSLNCCGVLFLVASISRFVFVSTTLKWAVCVAIQQNIYRQSPDGATETFLPIFLAVCRIWAKLHSLSNILYTRSIFIKMWAQI